MTELLQFFLQPYQTATTFNILLEFLAALFGVVSVVYARRENILVFPTGIVSTAIYVYLLSQWALYGDLIINVYYTLMSIYGWYMWHKVIDDKQSHISISRTSTKDKLKAFGIFLFTTVFVIAVYRYYDVMPNRLNFRESVLYAWQHLSSGSLDDFRTATPFLDTFTTGIFFSAMWLMANKKIENWILWIVGDLVSIPLYFVKGYGFTGIQYAVFLGIAIMAYFSWRKAIENQKAG
ncbi:MAG: nicotinamide riboside transporter PnuC [Bacteroidales bacterium]|nr:nicotinamide riboside transporter PnuC [Bacteroidales bacterium]